MVLSFKRALLASVGPGLILGFIGAASARGAFRVLFRDFFSAECVAAPSGGKVLRIEYTDAAGDMRDHFLDLSRVIGFGLHVFDYQFVLDDLIELVRKRREARLAAGP